MIVGNCELDDMAGRVRKRTSVKVFSFTCLFVCLVVSKQNSIAVLSVHLLLFSLPASM